MQKCNDNPKSIILLVGKSGTGKSTLVKAMGLREVISMISRKLRPGEIDGVHLYHMSWDAITAIPDDQVIARNSFDGHMYGATVEEAWKGDVYIVDPVGVSTYIERYDRLHDIPKPTIVYLTAPVYIRFVRMIKRELKGQPRSQKIRSFFPVVYRALKRIHHDRKTFAGFAYHADHVLSTG